MADEKQRGKDPHLGYRFWVEITGVEVAGFSDCSGLTVETEVFEYIEGGENTYTHKLPVRTKYSNITLKRGIDPGQDLHSWYLKSINGNTERRNISIRMYGQFGDTIVKEWVLHQAYPVKWTGPDLKTDAGAVAIETLEFAHSGLLSNNAKNK